MSKKTTIKALKRITDIEWGTSMGSWSGKSIYIYRTINFLDLTSIAGQRKYITIYKPETRERFVYRNQNP